MSACKNCGTRLGETEDYCSACGAKVIRNRLTIRNLWGDFTEQFLNYDNKLLKTFVQLFRNPEDVIGSYINGTRKKYVNVVSYFALALTLSGIQIFVIRKFFPEALDIGAFLPENAANTSTVDMDWVYDYQSIVALINLPVYAIMARLTFFGKKKFNYTEHLVIMTYIMGQFTIISFFAVTTGVILGGNFYILNNFAILFLALYTIYCYRRLYPLSIKQCFKHIGIFLLVVLVFLIGVTVIQAVVMYLNGDMDKMIQDAIEAQKQRQAS